MSETTEEHDDDIVSRDFDGSETFTEALVGQVNRSDLLNMVHIQREMLSRYEKTNEMLINFNMLSTSRFEATSQEFKQHTQLLYEMRKDLDIIFRRIRTLKQRLSSMYPDAFADCSDVYNILVDQEDEEECVDDVKAKKDETPPSDSYIKDLTDNQDKG